MTQLIVALDEPDYGHARVVVERTAPAVEWYKVGYEAYYGYGDLILTLLREAGKQIFLDLKLHDIPNTVTAAVRASARSGATLLTVHAGGGATMLSAAVAAKTAGLRIIAVTVLTSLTAEDLRSVGIASDPKDQALRLALLARNCGIDGVVCAVEDAARIRRECGPGFAIVCPGVRPPGAPAGDQRRVATPADAALAGADFIVVGRPVTKSDDPGAAARAIVDQLRLS
ncbi:MAG TPA: orotidine-5'-phosphate decarboxylase [Candidatus Eremiobacteraceae bacterium]|nr:orotidine-5'-phosphate decarboxylase [Candidatus Eremiobacteraceae bacterium]